MEGRVFSARVVPENAGERMVCFLREVTEPDVLLERLEAGERQFWRIINGIPLGVVIGELVNDSRGKPPDIRIVAANATFEDHTGIARRIFSIDKQAGFSVRADESDIGWIYFTQRGGDGEPVEMWLYLTKMSPRYVHLSVSAFSPAVFACIINDIIEKKSCGGPACGCGECRRRPDRRDLLLNRSGYFIWARLCGWRCSVGPSDLGGIHVSI